MIRLMVESSKAFIETAPKLVRRTTRFYTLPSR